MRKITVSKLERSLVGSPLGTTVDDASGFAFVELLGRLTREPRRHQLVFGRGMVSDDTANACMAPRRLAHMYSSRRPPEWESRMVGEGWINDYKAWLNLPNDDLFMHRFGSPYFAREFIRNMPLEHIRGFYRDSDGYLWGREFIDKEPTLAGRLDMDKH